MKQNCLFTVILFALFFLVSFAPPPVFAAVTDMYAYGTASNDGKTWVMTFCSTGPLAPSGNVVVQYVAFWCSGASSSICSNLAFDGVSSSDLLLPRLYDVTSTIDLPAYSTSVGGEQCGKQSPSFTIAPSEPPYPCGRIQADVLDSNGSVIGGTVYNTGVSCPSPTGTITPTPQDTPPDITSLQIDNADPSQTNFNGPYGTIGSQNTQDGSNWQNPMAIKLTAQEGSLPVTQYYYTMYDASFGQLINQSSFLTDIQAKIDANPAIGVLLAYGTGINGNTTNKFYVRKNHGWVEVSDDPLKGTEVKVNNVLIYTVYLPRTDLIAPHSAAWKVAIQKEFGSKHLYTAAYVSDGVNSAFMADMSPSPIPTPIP